MDYKKKYEEVLERAKEIIECSNSDTKEVRMVLSFFPELKWNKDEQMRKKCIELIKELKTFCMRDGQDECIAWLKKQGEQKSVDKVEPKFKVGDKIYLKPEYRMPDDDTPIANTVFKIRAIDDKHYRFDRSYIFIEDQDKYELIEQKLMKTCAEYYNKDSELKMPELSVFQNKLADILMQREYEGSTETEEDIARARLEYELAAIRISEELLPFAIMQKSAEWSEEDERLFQIIIDILDKEEHKGHLSHTELIDCVKKLKSLRPNHWRPSDAQMEVLVWCKPLFADTKSKGILESLINDLKNL